MGSDDDIHDGTAVDGPGWKNNGDQQIAVLTEVAKLKTNGEGDVQIFTSQRIAVTLAVLTNGGRQKSGDPIDAIMRGTVPLRNDGRTRLTVHEHTRQTFPPMPSLSGRASVTLC